MEGRKERVTWLHASAAEPMATSEEKENSFQNIPFFLSNPVYCPSSWNTLLVNFVPPPPLLHTAKPSPNFKYELLRSRIIAFSAGIE